MIRKKHNNALQINPRQREEEPQNINSSVVFFDPEVHRTWHMLI